MKDGARRAIFNYIAIWPALCGRIKQQLFCKLLFWFYLDSAKFSRYSAGFLVNRSIDNSIAKSIHFSIKSFMRS